jgi:serine/threonine protein kinase
MAKLKRAVQVTSQYSIDDAVKESQKAADIESNDEHPTAVLSKGTIFAGNYEILSQLGHGGMGIVYKARQVDNDRIVGLKVLHPHLVTDSLSRARFEQEAEKSELTHRNLIEIFQFGFSSAGQPFLAMEFLDGSSLNDILAIGPLSLGSFTNIFTQVCEGLFHAHNAGVIHRDIKPSNIMVSRLDNENTIVKIVDFGIAKSNIASESRLTPTGEVLGSPLYMSPEQCAGGAPDPRSDIYSLGCVMYEAITGTAPFNHSNPIKLILMQISERPPAFIEANPDATFSHEQERIVMKALEKDPSRRYQTAEELGRDLWQLTILGSSGMVRKFGGDLRKSGNQSDNNLLANAGEVVDVLKSAGKPKKLMTFRFRKIKQPHEKDQFMQAMEIAQKLIKKGADMSVFLDYEAVHLVHRSDLMAPEFHPDIMTTDKIHSIQNSLQKLIKSGASINASEHWLRYFGILAGGPDAILPGILVLDEDALAEYLMERATSIMDYT